MILAPPCFGKGSGQTHAVSEGGNGRAPLPLELRKGKFTQQAKRAWERSGAIDWRVGLSESEWAWIEELWIVMEHQSI